MADDERDGNAPKPSTKGEPDSWWSAYSKLEPHTVNAGIKMHRLAGVKMHHGPDATTAVFSGTGKPGA